METLDRTIELIKNVSYSPSSIPNKSEQIVVFALNSARYPDIKWYFSRMIKAKPNYSVFLLYSGVVFVTIGVTPWNNLDPVSVTKLFLISLFSSMSLVAILFSTNKNITPILRRLANLWILCSIVIVGLNLMLRPQFISERIFGISGRNVGAIFLLSSFLILWSSFMISFGNKIHLLIINIKCSSSLLALYFFLQKFGLDRAQWVDAYDGTPSSTLGNPNFVSAFVAIGFVTTLPFVFAKETQNKLRILLVLVGGLEFWVILQSNSMQGLFISLIGLIIIILIQTLFFLAKRGIRTNIFIGILTGSSILLATAFFDLSSFTSSQNSTLLARFDYWRAGLSMILNSPVLGQGLDYFGESYFKFRSESAALRSPGLFTDSAHNYFIDFGSFGGLPLLIVFSMPIFFVLVKVLKRCFLVPYHQQTYSKPNAFVLGVVLAWFGFFFQSLISPISHALMYLGMVLTGFLCATNLDNHKDPEITMRIDSKSKSTSKSILSQRPKFTRLAVKFAVALAASTFAILGVQPMIADAKFRDAIEQGNGGKLLELALNEPLNFNHMQIASQIFLENKRPDLALRIIRTMVNENPGNIRGWRLLRSNSLSALERERAGEEMLKLDPFNAELRKELSATP